MRRVLWFAIGFGAASGICAYWLLRSWNILLPVFLLFLGIGFCVLGRNRIWPRRIGYCILGCAIGFFWFLGFRQGYLINAIELDGETRQVTVTASDYSFDTDYGTGVDGTLTLKEKTFQVRLYINEKKSIEPGDTVTSTFKFRVTTPDSDQGSTYHQGKGIFLLAYQAGEVSVSEGKTSIAQYPALWRQKILSILETCFPEDTVAFVQALFLGETYGLDYETDTAFKVSGIRHIIAVSGLHISILYGLLSAVTFKKRYLTALLGIPVLLLFAAVAGFTPSVTRACIMVCLMILAMALNREYDGPTALAFSCLIMMMANQMVITNVGFQLSVTSVAGIFLFQGSIREWLKKYFGKGKGKHLGARLNRWFCGSVSVTLSAISLTTPLCAYYFGTVSLIGILTNLLTLWAVSIIFYGIVAVILASFLSVSAAKFVGELLAYVIRYVLFAARTLSRVPLAAVYTKCVYIVIWLIFLYALLAVFLLMKKKRARELICCAAAGLCLALLCSWTEPLADECRVTVLDVGQGQSILLQSQGRTYLVDCGGDSDETTADIVAETLLSQGIRRLDGIILTHFDNDHAGAVQNLLNRIEIDALFLPDVADDGAGEAIASRTEGAVFLVFDDLELTFGDGKITIFGPIYSGNSNENSLCVLFETENCAILITGDRSAFGERTLLRETSLPDVDVLIAGHHGSKYSTSQALLDAIRPEIVLISVGENSYGHPSEEVLTRLAEFGCTVYRTDLCGTIIYRR